MIKSQELTNPKSCLSRAADDEMIFVLLARDAAAPRAIREWAIERICLVKNMPGDAQIVEALAVAESIEQEHYYPGRERGNSLSMNAAIRATFPDPAATANHLGMELGTAPGTMLVTVDAATEQLRCFQRDTINALADRLVDAAARLESTNNHVTFEDLRREAQALRDYANTLVPAGPEVDRR